MNQQSTPPAKIYESFGMPNPTTTLANTEIEQVNNSHPIRGRNLLNLKLKKKIDNSYMP